MKYVLIICSLFLAVNFASAQNIVSLEQAFESAMKNNHQIQISALQSDIANNNANPGQAGLLPKVDLTGGYNYSNSNADLTFATGGPPMENLSAESKGYNSSIGMSYVLFNGFGNTYQFKLLQQQDSTANIQEKLSIESTLVQVSNVYLEICRQQEQLKIAMEMLEISKDRLSRLKNAQTYGVANSIDVLNAEVDYNNDQSNLVNIEYALNMAKRNLSLLVNEDLGTNYEVQTELIINGSLIHDELKQKSLKNNSNLLLAQSNITQQEYMEKIQKSFYMPRISINTSYGYSFSESNASLILSNQNLGLTGSVGLAWNLFDGNKRKTAIQNAAILLQTNEIAYDQAKKSVDKDFENTFELYQTQLKLTQLETRNLSVAQANFDKSKALYEKGQLTSLQFREAQINLIRVKNKLNNSTFASKMTEIELKRLAGDLLQNQ